MSTINQRLRISFALLIATVTSAPPVFAQATELFLFTDESDRLPVDPAANSKDTLDVELADVDADGDLDLFK